MGSTAEEKACLVGGVVIGVQVGTALAADPTGLTNLLYRGNASTSSGNFAINAAIRGKFLNIYAKSTNVQFAFSVNGVAATLVYDQNVTPGTGSIAAGGTVPMNTVFPVIIHPRATHISFISQAATDKLEMYVSEYLSGGK